MFPIEDQLLTVQIPNATDATNQVVLIAPFDLKVISIELRHRVTSTSGTLDLKKAADVVTLANGTSLLTAVMSLSGVAETKVTGDLVTTIGGTVVPKGYGLGFVFAGTLTNLADLLVTLIVRQLKKF